MAYNMVECPFQIEQDLSLLYMEMGRHNHKLSYLLKYQRTQISRFLFLKHFLKRPI